MYSLCRSVYEFEVEAPEAKGGERKGEGSEAKGGGEKEGEGGTILPSWLLWRERREKRR